MTDPLYLPIVDEAEARQLLAELPMAFEADRFLDFVMGFPRRYLVSTPRIDIVRHFLLMESSRGAPVISSVYKESGSWKLCLVTEDRKALFSNVAGALSCHGCDISSAEAFANANSIVLDTFQFTDPERNFVSRSRQQQFQAFLEALLRGEESLQERLWQRLEKVQVPDIDSLKITFDNDCHPTATRLLIDSPDHFAHLYLIGRRISNSQGQIEMAYVDIEADRVKDEFYLTSQGSKLSPSQQDRMRMELSDVGVDFHVSRPVV